MLIPAASRAHVGALVLLLGIPQPEHISCISPAPCTFSRLQDPAGLPDLLGLLPSDGQQAGGALGELALPNDDQVSYSPCPQQVPVGRGRKKSWGIMEEKSCLSSKPGVGSSKHQGG